MTSYFGAKLEFTHSSRTSDDVFDYDWLDWRACHDSANLIGRLLWRKSDVTYILGPRYIALKHLSVHNS